ncbi:unnamed protein product [Acanthoscelides obtectus]|uniref:Uncharacterized protein n=1 Tax=Acanthoscelides obtectus TaxID=200917 RepID=A0A9P0LV00_ACAOB|nr:unnamed protein product [Acanthoscelides obtectus]CAK1655876.1 hypothetical protein AOBTE_LOCUS19407 [Acanthoscelides obtectus]
MKIQSSCKTILINA